VRARSERFCCAGNFLSSPPPTVRPGLGRASCPCLTHSRGHALVGRACDPRPPSNRVDTGDAARQSVESFAGGRERPREANLRAGAPAVRVARRRAGADAPTAIRLAAGRPAPTRIFSAATGLSRIRPGAAGLSRIRPGAAAISATTVGRPHRRPVRQLAVLISVALTRLARRTPVRAEAVATRTLPGLDIGGAPAGPLADRQTPVPWVG